MKNKQTLIIVTILGGLMAMSPIASAQDAAKTDAKPAAKTEAGAPAQAVRRPDRLQQLDKALTLTAEQKAKIKLLLDDQAKQMKALRPEPGADRKEAAAKARKLNDDTNAKIKEALTPEQQTKFTEMLTKQRQPNRPAPKDKE